MIYQLKQNLLTLTILLGVAGLIGCASNAKPTEQANAKPSATTETNTKVTNNPGSSNNSGTTTVEKTTVENKDGIKSTTYENTTKITPAGDKIGVPECDEYIEKYEACITGKVPEAARGAMKSSIEQMRTSWKQVAANPQARAALAGGCKQAQETSKQAMSAYACAW